MFELKNKYIKDYWFNDNIIDCGKSSDNLSEEIPVIISDSEINIITQTHLEYLFEPSNNLENPIELNKEKLNSNYKINNTLNYNDYRTGKNKSNSKSNISDFSSRNTEYYHQLKTYRTIISNNKMFNMGKTSQYHKLFNKSCTNNDQRNMCNLSKTSRLYEFKTNKRNVLLDSQSKPQSLIS